MVRKLLILAMITGGLALISEGLVGSAVLAAEMKLAQGGSCTASCRAQYNQCRISTKGSPSCDAKFAACMRRCIATRKR